jgi:hypothetical protein
LLLIGNLKGSGFVYKIGLKMIGPIGIPVDVKFAGIIAFVKPIADEMGYSNIGITAQLGKPLHALQFCPFSLKHQKKTA